MSISLLAVSMMIAVSTSQTSMENLIQLPSFHLLNYTSALSKPFRLEMTTTDSLLSVTFRSKEAKQTSVSPFSAAVVVQRKTGEGRCSLSIPDSMITSQSTELGSVAATLVKWLIKDGRANYTAEVELEPAKDDKKWHAFVDSLPRRPGDFVSLTIEKDGKGVFAVSNVSRGR